MLTSRRRQTPYRTPFPPHPSSLRASEDRNLSMVAKIAGMPGIPPDSQTTGWQDEKKSTGVGSREGGRSLPKAIHIGMNTGANFFLLNKAPSVFERTQLLCSYDAPGTRRWSKYWQRWKIEVKNNRIIRVQRWTRGQRVRWKMLWKSFLSSFECCLWSR